MRLHESGAPALNNPAQSQSEKESLDKNDTQAEKDLIEAVRRQRGFTHAAVNAVLQARGLLRLTIAATLTALAGGDDLVSWLYAQLVEEKLRSLQLLRANRILRERMYRIDNRHRNRYTPRERFLIVLYKVTYGLTAEQTASEFVVSPQTVKRWIDQAVREPCKRTIGSLLKAVPPLMGYSDLLRDQVGVMVEMGFGGNLLIAQTLARAGVKLSRETIRRWRNQGRMPGGADARPRPTKTGPILKAKYPNHIWMLDITEIAGLFGLFRFKLAVVLDVFSRMPLAGKVFTSEPSAADMVALVEHAAAKHGAPKHFVTDRGSQFTSDVFRAALIGLGVMQRFGAVGATGSIAIIERFWRTMKDMLLLKVRPPLTTFALNQRLLSGLQYFAYLKPHQGLGGATPAEIFYGRVPARTKAKRPARAYENKQDDPLFEISYLDPDGLLPMLIPKTQAA
jgi:transposase InsO family protein